MLGIQKLKSALRTTIFAFTVFAIIGGGWSFTERGLVVYLQPPISAESATLTPEYIRAHLTNPEVQKAALERQGVPASQVDVYVDYQITLWNSELVVDAFIADVLPALEAADQSSPDSFIQFGVNYSLLWLQELSAKGMNRLPIEDVRFLVGMSRTIANSISAQECAALSMNELSASEMAQLELKALAGLPDSILERNLSIVQKSVLAELRDSPPLQTLDPSEQMAVEHALGKRALEIIYEQPNAERLMNAFTNMNNLTDAETCQFNILMTDVLVNEEGELGDWMLRYSLSTSPY